MFGIFGALWSFFAGMNVMLVVATIVALLPIVFLLLLFYNRRQFSRSAVMYRRCENMALKVVFLHPDLGLGGAERLIVDAVIGLQSCQKRFPVAATIVTTRHDPARAFPETVDGSIRVVTRGEWFPTSILSRFKVLCATVRMLDATIATCFNEPDTDIFVVDQVAAVMPILKILSPGSAVFFYCHFPDQCCDANRPDGVTRGSLPYRMYRVLFDAVERWAMGYADVIVSNSKFSRSITVKTFPSLASVIDPEDDILYPPVSVNTKPPQIQEDANNGKDAATKSSSSSSSSEDGRPSLSELQNLLTSHTAIVSVNRYEAKKNIDLAINAFALLRTKLNAKEAAQPAKPLLLVIAGGYDDQLEENVAYYKNLQSLAKEKGIHQDCICFLRNISDMEKRVLLHNCTCLVYTPPFEHFGIVPVEAMFFGKPVIAVNAGGPTESVCAGDQYGLLREPTAEAFMEAMLWIVTHESEAIAMGERAKERALKLFHLNAFSEKLMRKLFNLSEKKIMELQKWNKTLWDAMQYRAYVNVLASGEGTTQPPGKEESESESESDEVVDATAQESPSQHFNKAQ